MNPERNCCWQCSMRKAICWEIRSFQALRSVAGTLFTRLLGYCHFLHSYVCIHIFPLFSLIKEKVLHFILAQKGFDIQLIYYGIGQVKAAQLKCIAELAVRIAQASRIKEVRLNNPETVAFYYMESLRHEPREKLLLASVITDNNMISQCDSKNTPTLRHPGCHMDVRLAGGGIAAGMIVKQYDAPDNIKVSFPVVNGVIADYNNMQAMIGEVLEKHVKRNMKGAEFIVAVPTDITEVEKKAFFDLFYKSRFKPKNVLLCEKPIADAVISLASSGGVFSKIILMELQMEFK